LEPWLRRILRE